MQANPSGHRRLHPRQRSSDRSRRTNDKFAIAIEMPADDQRRSLRLHRPRRRAAPQDLLDGPRHRKALLSRMHNESNN
ncbi:MAG: hypothetical protein MZU97_26660 [Bacillus subtilis]|nr:hypothetical protein [Bacillus subtilis]